MWRLWQGQLLRALQEVSEAVSSGAISRRALDIVRGRARVESGSGKFCTAQRLQGALPCRLSDTAAGTCSSNGYSGASTELAAGSQVAG
jgi:hypothetical protein